jgi:ATP-dependent 26S proteasome regulatory subunit
MKSDTLRLQHEQSVMKEKIRDNGEKIKQNKVLPYLVGNVVEVRATRSYRHRLHSFAIGLGC